jgi:hypothetical protein
VLLPLTSKTGTKTPAAVLVAGVNPRHALDNTYNIFFNLVASQVGALIANASSKEEEHQMVQVRRPHLPLTLTPSMTLTPSYHLHYYLLFFCR